MGSKKDTVYDFGASRLFTPGVFEKEIRSNLIIATNANTVLFMQGMRQWQRNYRKRLNRGFLRKLNSQAKIYALANEDYDNAERYAVENTYKGSLYTTHNGCYAGDGSYQVLIDDGDQFDTTDDVYETRYYDGYLAKTFAFGNTSLPIGVDIDQAVLAIAQIAPQGDTTIMSAFVNSREYVTSSPDTGSFTNYTPSVLNIDRAGILFSIASETPTIDSNYSNTFMGYSNFAEDGSILVDSTYTALVSLLYGQVLPPPPTGCKVEVTYQVRTAIGSISEPELLIETTTGAFGMYVFNELTTIIDMLKLNADNSDYAVFIETKVYVPYIIKELVSNVLPDGTIEETEVETEYFHEKESNTITLMPDPSLLIEGFDVPSIVELEAGEAYMRAVADKTGLGKLTFDDVIATANDVTIAMDLVIGAVPLTDIDEPTDEVTYSLYPLETGTAVHVITLTKAELVNGYSGVVNIVFPTTQGFNFTCNFNGIVYPLTVQETYELSELRIWTKDDGDVTDTVPTGSYSITPGQGEKNVVAESINTPLQHQWTVLSAKPSSYQGFVDIEYEFSAYKEHKDALVPSDFNHTFYTMTVSTNYSITENPKPGVFKMTLPIPGYGTTFSRGRNLFENDNNYYQFKTAYNSGVTTKYSFPSTVLYTEAISIVPVGTAIDSTPVIVVKENRSLSPTEEKNNLRLFKKLNVTGEDINAGLTNTDIFHAHLGVYFVLGGTNEELSEAAYLYFTYIFASGLSNMRLVTRNLTIDRRVRIEPTIVTDTSEIAALTTNRKLREYWHTTSQEVITWEEYVNYGDQQSWQTRSETLPVYDIFFWEDTNVLRQIHVVVLNPSRAYTVDNKSFDGNVTLFPVPLDFYNSLKYKQWEALYEYGTYISTFVKKEVKLKWYQTDLFKVVIVIISVVLAYFSSGTSLSWTEALKSALYGIVVSIVVSFVLQALASIIGGTIGAIIAAIAVVIALYYGGYIQADSWFQLANTTLSTVNQAITHAYQAELASLADAASRATQEATLMQEKLNEILEDDVSLSAFSILSMTNTGVMPVEVFEDTERYCNRFLQTDVSTLVDYSIAIDNAITARSSVDLYFQNL